MSESKIQEIIAILWSILAACLWEFDANIFIIVFAVIMSSFSYGASLAYAFKEIRKEKNK